MNLIAAKCHQGAARLYDKPVAARKEHLSIDEPARRPVFRDVQNASGHEERQVRRRVGGRVVRPQALIGRGVADNQRLLPQQRLAEHLLPPVVHLRREVVRVSPEQLVPASLQKDAVLPHTGKEKKNTLQLVCDVGDGGVKLHGTTLAAQL